MNKIESQRNSKHWNAPFHPMKRTIPSYETHSFILWNAQFQCLKLYGCQYLTNHSLISDKRIASKFGVGKFNNVYGISCNNVTAGQKDYAARMMQIEKQREEYYKSLGTLPGVPTMKGATADPDNTVRGYNDIIGDLGDHSVPEGWVQRPKFNDKGDVPGPPVQWQKPEDPDNAQPGYGYVPTDTTNIEDIFFYHSDHLGSTSYITDAKANITQFDAYLPYGELLVDEHTSSEDIPISSMVRNSILKQDYIITVRDTNGKDIPTTDVKSYGFPINAFLSIFDVSNTGGNTWISFY